MCTTVEKFEFNYINRTTIQEGNIDVQLNTICDETKYCLRNCMGTISAFETKTALALKYWVFRNNVILHNIKPDLVMFARKTELRPYFCFLVDTYSMRL